LEESLWRIPRNLLCGKESCGEAIVIENESRKKAIVFEEESLGEDMEFKHRLAYADNRHITSCCSMIREEVEVDILIPFPLSMYF
jgi:hypothetical protein